MASVSEQIVQNANMTNQARMQSQMQDGVRQSNQSVSSHDFLYLLTQQLQYQDPMNPMDNSQMLAQEAQFTTLEQMENLTSSFSSFSSNFQANMLLGQCVRVEVDGQGYVGYVDAVDYTSENGASILIGDRWFPLSAVTNTYYIAGEAQPADPTEPSEPDEAKPPSELDKTKDGIVQEANPDIMLPTAGYRVTNVPSNKDSNTGDNSDNNSDDKGSSGDNSNNDSESTNPVSYIKSTGRKIIQKIARQAYETVQEVL